MGSGGPSTGASHIRASDERNDAELLAAFRAGDLGVFSILYERHRPAATRFARGLASSEFAANDAVSDAFLRIYSALSKGEGPQEAFRGYLFSAVRSAIVDDVRRTSRVRYTDDLQSYEDSTERLDMAAVAEDREFISKAFSALTDQWKQVLWLTSVEGRRHNEVAEILGLKANAVAALALRAREGLRQNYLTAHLSTTETRDECRRTVKNLAALVRSKISPREKAHAEGHLQDCRRCRVAATMLTDLNRVMPAIALPALLAPAPWLTRLTASGGSGTGGPSGTGHGHVARQVRPHPASSSAGRAASFVGSHAVAIVAAAAVVIVAGSAAVAANIGTHASAHSTALRPTVTAVSSARPGPSSTTPVPSPTKSRKPSPQPSTSRRSTRATHSVAPKSRPPSNSSSPAESGKVPPTLANSSIAYQIYLSLNRTRAAHGLTPLRWSPALVRAAAAHTNAMIAGHAFSHQVSGEPGFGARLAAQGASCTGTPAAAENIGETSETTLAGALAVQRDMASEQPPDDQHTENILGPFTAVGIAAGVDHVQNNLLITEDFCRS